MRISERVLRNFIREKIIEATVQKYRGGGHAQYFAGGDPAFNMPEIDGINVDIERANNDIEYPLYVVSIDVESMPSLNLKQIFKDEEEARKFAKDRVEFIKRSLSLSQKENR